MAGIVGIIQTEYNLGKRDALDSMLSRIMHDGSSSSGRYIEKGLGVLAGWVSRSGAFSESMPVWNEKKNVCLILSGEDYTDRSEIDRLLAKGHQFDPDNASYIVHLYEELGLKFLDKLNGWFSGIVVDLREQAVVLFNDRYGIGRIYIHQSESGFYFSSEAKSLLRVLPELRRCDLKSLGEFFSCGCVLQNRTLFTGISLLPPGSAWLFTPGRDVRRQTYFSCDVWENQQILSASEYYEKLKETWKQILPRYFRGHGRIGLSLTGGVDSRMILAWARSASGELPCYTFGSTYRQCADVAIAKEAAGVCQQPHKVISIGSDFLSQFPLLAEAAIYLSDGAMDVSGALDLYVQHFVLQIAPIRVTGTNGGELLRRIVAFEPKPACRRLLQHDFAELVDAASTAYSQELECHRLSFTAFKQAPWSLGSKFILERSQLTLRMPYFDNELVALAYQAPAAATQGNAVSLQLIADGNPALKLVETDRGLAGRHPAGLASVFNAFEEFLFKAEYAFDYGMPQWLAQIDHAVAPLRLERLFLGRHKFTHFRSWYRDELSRYVKAILLDARALSRPYLRRERVQEVVSDHVSGRRNYTRELHKLLSMELVQRKLIEQD